ncbi:U44-like protein, partial [Lissonota sp. PSUC_FEM 10030012]|nr:U44-like protein [Lissonota sp. PSUC_FEM 10030012]
VKGKRFQNRTIYDQQDARPRTDTSFRNQTNRAHHRDCSPLFTINPPIDMVKHFSLDFMHLCCLGVMKKMFMDFWLRPKVLTRLGRTSRLRLSELLKKIKNQIPDEFQRTTRELDEIARWKATEFRFFLLYAGPVLLKKILPKELYSHFLLFHVACRILCTAEMASKYNDEAKLFLKTFCSLASELYGQQCQILNMHSLIHLADDAKNMNCTLSELTAFPFENTLGQIKKLVRSGNRPLAQVSRRLHERFYLKNEKATMPPEFIISKKRTQGHNELQQISKVKNQNFVISTKPPNNVVLLKNGTILQVITIYKEQGEEEIKLQGRVLRIKRSIFLYPCDSSLFSMWQVQSTQDIKTCLLNSVHKKVVLLDVGNIPGKKLYCIPLIH